MILTREQILNATDMTTETVAVPEWGGSVLVRGLTGIERDRFEQDSVKGKGSDARINLINMRARLVAASIVDEGGKRLFGSGDIELLGNKSAAALTRVFNVAQRLSGFTQDDIKELTQNFDEGQTGDSSSD